MATVTHLHPTMHSIYMHIHIPPYAQKVVNLGHMYHDLDHLHPILQFWDVVQVCILQVQSRKDMLDHADYYSAAARQHEPDHTDQECICLERI